MTTENAKLYSLAKRAGEHLSWMIATLDFNNSQTGIDAEDSPELKDAKKLFEEIKGI